jgi:hypothetical protein
MVLPTLAECFFKGEILMGNAQLGLEVAITVSNGVALYLRQACPCNNHYLWSMRILSDVAKLTIA